MNDDWLSPHNILYGSFATAALPPARLSPCTATTAEDGSPESRMLFFLILAIITGEIATVSWMRRWEGRLFARRHLAPPGNTVDHPDPGCANRIDEGYLRPHAAVCVRRRAISCTRRRSASSRIGSDATSTAYTNVELPCSDPFAR